MKDINKTTYITKNELCSRENWNSFVITYLDIEPDMYSKNTETGNTEKLFMLDRIKEIEKSEEYKKYMNASPEEQRLLFGKAKRDLAKTLEIAMFYSIGVKYEPTIQIKTIQYQISINPELTFSLNEVNWLKLIVNRIRSSYTNYNNIVTMIRSHRGAKRYINIVNFRTLSRIASVYREYEEECLKQAHATEIWLEKNNFTFNWESGEVFSNKAFDPYQDIQNTEIVLPKSEKILL